MREVTLTVPAEHVDAFRAAVLREIGIDGNHIGEESESVVRLAVEGSWDDPAVDLRRGIDQLAEGMRVLDQLGWDEDEVEVTASAGALLHIAETMARHVVGARLAERLEIGPLPVPEARKQVDALAWAIDQAERLQQPAAAEAREGDGAMKAAAV